MEMELYVLMEKLFLLTIYFIHQHQRYLVTLFQFNVYVSITIFLLNILLILFLLKMSLTRRYFLKEQHVMASIAWKKFFLPLMT